MNSLTSCVSLLEQVTESIQLRSHHTAELRKQEINRTWPRTRCCISETALLEKKLEISALVCFDLR
jgi:hypothetical protein